MANSKENPCRDLRVHIFGENGTGVKRNAWVLWAQAQKPHTARRVARLISDTLPYVVRSAQEAADFMMSAEPAYLYPRKPFLGADALFRLPGGEPDPDMESSTWFFIYESARGCTAETAAKHIWGWAKAEHGRCMNPLYRAEEDEGVRLMPAGVLMMPGEWDPRKAASAWLPARAGAAYFNWPGGRLEEYKAQQAQRKGGAAL